jgi:hypothetical protein
MDSDGSKRVRSLWQIPRRRDVEDWAVWRQTLLGSWPAPSARSGRVFLQSAAHLLGSRNHAYLTVSEIKEHTEHCCAMPTSDHAKQEMMNLTRWLIFRSTTARGRFTILKMMYREIRKKSNNMKFGSFLLLSNTKEVRICTCLYIFYRTRIYSI